ncbi:hypothetical protein MIR68_011273 [Amoeboaphelidium protococcarum]|nr:hypothetical protein MIR68_011273 [Amoeboaphelidium protococcarum]
MYRQQQPVQQQIGANTARVNELLEAIRHEFELASQDSASAGRHRDDYEHKLYQAQLSEMQQMQTMFFELDRVHQSMRAQYEEEVVKLRRELESRGIAVPSSQVQQIAGPLLFGSQFTAPNGSGGGSSGMQSHQQPQSQAGQQMAIHPPSHAAPGHANGFAHQGAPHYGPQSAAQASFSQQQQSQQHLHPQQHQQSQQQGMRKMSISQQQQQHQAHPQHLQQLPQQQQQASQIQQGQQPLAAPTSAGVAASRLHPPQQQKIIVFGDVEVESIPSSHRHDGPDWHGLFNPKLPRTVDVKLNYSFDHASVVCCVRFSADGKFLATGCNKITSVYNVQTGAKVATLKDENVESDGDLYIRSVCFSPDGKLLATGAEDRLIRLWDIAQNKVVKQFSGHEQDIYSLDYSMDGKIIVSGSGDRTARIWSIEDEECKQTLTVDDSSSATARDAGITSVAISADGKYVAAGSLDKMVRVWNAEDGHLLAQMDGHKDSVYSVAFNPNADAQHKLTLVSGSLDKTLKLWDLSELSSQKDSADYQPSCIGTLVGHRDFVLSVAFSPDGTFLLSGSKDRSVQIWDVRTQTSMMVLHGHKNSVISVAVSPAGNLLATGSGDCKARCWQIDSLLKQLVSSPVSPQNSQHQQQHHPQQQQQQQQQQPLQSPQSAQPQSGKPQHQQTQQQQQQIEKSSGGQQQ